MPCLPSVAWQTSDDRRVGVHSRHAKTTRNQPADCQVPAQDFLGGLQWWTITAAAGGGYTIQMLTGREDCNPSASYLSTVACGANTVELVNANAGGGLQTWAITPTPAPPPVVEAPFVPYFTNGTYTIVNRGRPTCGADFSYNDCTGNTATFLSTTPGERLPGCACSDPCKVHGPKAGLLHAGHCRGPCCSAVS